MSFSIPEVGVPVAERVEVTDQRSFKRSLQAKRAGRGVMLDELRATERRETQPR